MLVALEAAGAEEEELGRTMTRGEIGAGLIVAGVGLVAYVVAEYAVDFIGNTVILRFTAGAMLIAAGVLVRRDARGL